MIYMNHKVETKMQFLIQILFMGNKVYKIMKQITILVNKFKIEK